MNKISCFVIRLFLVILYVSEKDENNPLIRNNDKAINPKGN